MMTQTALTAALVFSLQSAPAQNAEVIAASDTDTTEAAAEPEKEASEVEDGDEMVCRRTVVTGSKFTRRVCATRREWTILADRSRDAAQEIQRRGQGLDPNAN